MVCTVIEVISTTHPTTTISFQNSWETFRDGKRYREGFSTCPLGDNLCPMLWQCLQCYKLDVSFLTDIRRYSSRLFTCKNCNFGAYMEEKNFRGLEHLRGWSVLDIRFWIIFQGGCNMITAIWFESGIHWRKACGMYTEEIKFYVHSSPQELHILKFIQSGWHWNA